MKSFAAILFVVAAALANEGPCVELYDVSDLVAAAQDFPPAGEQAKEGIDVVEALKAGLPDMKWGEEAEIRSNAGLVEVRAPREVQDRVRVVLESLRKNRQTLIQVEAKLVEIDLADRSGLLKRAGVSVSKEGVDGAHCRATLTALQAQILLARIGHETKGSWLLSSPRLTVFHAQRASITIASQTAYIEDYDQEMVGTSIVCDPLIGVFTDGLVLDLRAIRPAEGHMRLAGRAKTSSLLGLEDLPVALLNGTTATIQMPHAAVEELTFNVEMADGETLLLLGGVRRDGRAAMWLVTPTVVDTR
ncbi:MAG: hypothetical protein AAB434_03680 [Planctomycetota bacterium]